MRKQNKRALVVGMLIGLFVVAPASAGWFSTVVAYVKAVVTYTGCTADPDSCSQIIETVYDLEPAEDIESPIVDD